MRILIVDDDERNVRSTATFLKTRGFNNIDTLVDSRDVLKTVVSNECYNVVILDLNMPFVSGLSLIGPIKSIYPKTKILIVSAIDNKKSIERSLKLGASFYYMKPIDNNKLINDLNSLFKVKKLDEY